MAIKWAPPRLVNYRYPAVLHTTRKSNCRYQINKVFCENWDHSNSIYKNLSSDRSKVWRIRYRVSSKLTLWARDFSSGCCDRCDLTSFIEIWEWDLQERGVDLTYGRAQMLEGLIILGKFVNIFDKVWGNIIFVFFIKLYL